MIGATIEELGHGIYCLDAHYIKEGVACCYLLIEGSQVAIIETGTAHTVEAIQAALGSLGLPLDAVRYVVPTHVHLDHAGGAGVLMARCREATLVVHPRGARHLIDPSRLIEGVKAVYGEDAYSELYGELVPVKEERVIVAEDGAVIELGGRSLQIRHTPGHAEHHFCVWDTRSQGWLTGDTFGLSYNFETLADERLILPTTTPVQFDPDKLLDSLDLLMSYDPRRMYLTHYGVLEAPANYVQSLKHQIRSWSQMALNLASEDGREQAIAEKLSESLRQQILEQWPNVDATEILNDLAMDIELNAQGIEVWLKRNEQ